MRVSLWHMPLDELKRKVAEQLGLPVLQNPRGPRG